MRGVFLDTETNGLNPFIHRVVEIAFKIIDLTTGEALDEYNTVVHQSLEDWKKSDPDSLKINGFTYETIKTASSAPKVATEITNIIQKNKISKETGVFICQNPSFDRIFFSQLIDPEIQKNLKWPYHWLDLASMYWAEAMRLGRQTAAKFPWNTGLSKDRIAAIYKLPPEPHPHRAVNGVNHLLLCYQQVVGFEKPAISKEALGENNRKK